ncbi:MAG TPA: carbohydrate porin [Hansschlegelia sp.]
MSKRSAMLAKGVAGSLLCYAALSATPAFAGDDEPAQLTGDFAERGKLTGDWGGARTKLRESGVEIDIDLTADSSYNLGGGLKKGKGFTSLLQLGLTLDLEKLVGWTGGEIYAGAYFIRGHGLSSHETGNLLPISNIEFPHANLLGEVYLKQKLLDDKLVIKIGQQAADGDFATSDTAGLFVNSTFGWPGLNGTDLYSGGPAYPVPTPGVYASYEFNEAFSVQAGLYNGDPAGRDDRNKHNLDFPVNDGAFAIGELIYKSTAGLPGTYKVGGWYNSLHFDDIKTGERRKGNYALYGVIDQTIWQGSEGGGDLKDPTPSDPRSLSVFARAVVAPQSNRNLVDWYFDLGFNAKGFVPNRADDVFGVAFAYAHVSKDQRDLDRAAGDPLHKAEMVVEASYQAKITGWLNIQPFFQYIVRPGGGDPDPDRPAHRLKDAKVIGFRTQVAF